MKCVVFKSYNQFDIIILLPRWFVYKIDNSYIIKLITDFKAAGVGEANSFSYMLHRRLSVAIKRGNAASVLGDMSLFEHCLCF